MDMDLALHFIDTIVGIAALAFCIYTYFKSKKSKKK